jgi:hypothetical protein
MQRLLNSPESFALKKKKKIQVAQELSERE